MKNLVTFENFKLNENLEDAAEEMYQEFLASEEGEHATQEAREIYPDYNSGDEDTDEAVDFIWNAFVNWCDNTNPGFPYLEVQDYICDEIYNGLT